MQTLSNILKWILVSSEDATKVSLTVKLALLGLIPYVMQAIGITCGLHLVCPAVGLDTLTQIALDTSNVVFLGLSMIASIGSISALIRKIFNTLNGTNAAFAVPSQLG